MSVPLGWESKKLADFILLQRGHDLPHRSRVPGKVKVLSSGEAHGWHNEASVQGPGFVVGRATNIGRPTWSDEDYWPLNTVLFAKDFKGNDPKFAYYWFLATDLTAYNSGSVQPMLNRNYIANVPIMVPPPEEQKGIAETLSAIDDKISSCRRLAEIVPALIRAAVEAESEDEALEVSVSDLARFVNGGAYTKDATGTGRVVIRIAELNSGLGRSTVYNDLDVPEDKTAKAGDLLMSWSGSLGVYRWALDEAIINQHIFKVVPNGYPGWLVFDRLDAVIDVFRRIAKDKATTMGHIQRHHLESTSVRVPSVAGVNRLSGEMEVLWDRLLVAEQQIRKLEGLKAALLPELIHGRIRVSEAAEAIA
jgi:type I restriction enzyme S subunit